MRNLPDIFDRPDRMLAVDHRRNRVVVRQAPPLEEVFEIVFIKNGRLEHTGQILRGGQVAPYLGSFNRHSYLIGTFATVEPVQVSRFSDALACKLE